MAETWEVVGRVAEKLEVAVKVGGGFEVSKNQNW